MFFAFNYSLHINNLTGVTEKVNGSFNFSTKLYQFSNINEKKNRETHSYGLLYSRLF